MDHFDKIAEGWLWGRKEKKKDLAPFNSNKSFSFVNDDMDDDDNDNGSFRTLSIFDNEEDTYSRLSDPAARAVPPSFTIAKRSNRFEVPTFNEGRKDKKSEEDMTKDLLDEYKRTRSKQSLEQLYGLYQRQIDTLVTGTATGRLPEPAVRAKTYSAFKDAVEKYDPNSPKKFYNYFVDNHFSSVRNYFRPYSNFRKVVHQRASNLDAVDKIRSNLELEFGRTPTNKEISTEYKNLYSKTLSERELKIMVKELASEHLGSGEMDDSYRADAGRQMYIAALRARDNFSPSDRKLFNALIVDPLEGKESKTQREISSSFGVSSSSMNRKSQDFRNAIQREYNVLTRG